jgi:hypothetical protein
MDGDVQSRVSEAGRCAVSTDQRLHIIRLKLENVPDAEIVDELRSQGVDETVAYREVNAILAFVVEGNQRMAKRLAKEHAIFDVLERLDGLTAASDVIDRLDVISADDFLEKYYGRSRPLVLRGMTAKWRAIGKWTPEFLREQYGDEKVEVMLDRSSDPDYEWHLDRHRREVVLRDFVDAVLTGGITNDYYMVANNRTLARSAFAELLDDMDCFPGILDPATIRQDANLWFGPAGTVTPLHHDRQNIFLVQLYGRKRVKLISPRRTHQLYNNRGVYSRVDPEAPRSDQFPLFRNVPVREVTLEAGDALFLPVLWWHHVRSLDISISISLSNFVFPNDYEIPNM